ncbi:MAG: ABC transporter substrate-binding protein [Desulfobacteraceae bacterium]|nr:ABC transporter substrate-binding protein [Desulfobacteraceae bacterium]
MNKKMICGVVSIMVVALLITSMIYMGYFEKEEEEEAIGETNGITEDTITIGSSAAITGHASFLGSQTINGSLAYIKEINANGGIHGRQIRLISYDDQYDPPQTVTNTQKLIVEDEAFLLFDYVGTPTSVKIIDTAQEANIPLVGLFTGAEALREPFRPYIFNARASYYDETGAAVDHFVDDLGFTKIAVLYQEDAFGLAGLTGVELGLVEHGLNVAAKATYVRGTMDVEDALETIEASDAEAVVMIGTYSPLAKFVTLARDQGYSPYFHTVSFVGSEAFAEELIDRSGGNVADVTDGHKILVTQVVPSPDSIELSLVEEYLNLSAKYFPQDSPNYVALEGFLNAKILVQALEAAGEDLTRTNFVNAMESISGYDPGIGKTITYGTDDHRGLDEVYLSHFVGGSFVLFEA